MQRVLDGDQELVLIERLDQTAEGPELGGGACRAGVADAGSDHDRDLRRLPAQPRDQLEAVAAGQAEVADRQLEAVTVSQAASA